jgi:hypothetical protein
MNFPGETSLQAKVQKVLQTMSFSSPEYDLTWLKKQTNVNLAETSKSWLI